MENLIAADLSTPPLSDFYNDPAPERVAYQGEAIANHYKSVLRTTPTAWSSPCVRGIRGAESG